MRKRNTMVWIERAMLRSKPVFLSGLVLLAALASFAQPQKHKGAPSAATTAVTAPASPAAKLQAIDELADRAMKEWKVPGVALAVVQDGKVIYAKGYGFRDVEQKLPVNTSTLFPIGSITKSFTSLSFAILKDEGKVDWDKPVRDYLPEFQMYDPIVTERATPRDLFAHRTGLPRHDLVWYSSDFSREDLVGRLRYLKPNKSFRSAYQYNNLTIMTMGYREGKLNELGWEGAIGERTFSLLCVPHSNLAAD